MYLMCLQHCNSVENYRVRLAIGRDVNKARGVKAKAENTKVNFSSKCQS